MCELVSVNDKGATLPVGRGVNFPNGTTITAFYLEEGQVLQCWHPETQEWSTMLPPVEGMGWELTAGSKVRTIAAKDAPAPAPSMVAQVERR